MPPDQEKPVLLVDGTGVLVRCAKAAGRMKPLSSHGIRTNELLLFINIIARHIRSYDPGSVIVCWDDLPPEGSWRHARCPEYKPERNYSETHFGLIQDFCSIAGFLNSSVRGYEADDIIAAWWRVIPKPRGIVIVSNDADFRQLLARHRTVQVDIDATNEWNITTLLERMHLLPSHWTLYRAVAGDRSDGIPGVPFYGPVKTLALLNECGWQRDKVFDRLPDDQAQIATWMEVMELRDPIFAPDSSAWAPGTWRYLHHQGQLMKFLSEWEMNSVLMRLVRGTLFHGKEPGQGTKRASVKDHEPAHPELVDPARGQA